ncbi:MAG: S8 family serine peptidase [Phycisphaerae bacterium]|nr:S8 family serine peptidase [Phycisphaerae bacterium]
MLHHKGNHALTFCVATVSVLGTSVADLEAGTPPNDPLFEQQWGLHNTGQDVAGHAGLVGADIDLLDAWDIHRGTRPVVVAIVGPGVNPHMEFADRLLPGFATAGDPRDWSDDCTDQGAFAAGIIAAEVNNGAGIAGIQDHVRILPVRIQTGCAIANQDLVEGIEWAVGQGAEIIIIPVASGTSSSIVEAAVEGADNAGVLVLAPAGNVGEPFVRFPAAYAHCLAVSSTDASDSTSGNYGPEMDVAAPGVNVISTDGSGGYQSFEFSTSAAIAHVAGVAALLRSYNPALTNAQIRQILLDTADDLGTPGWDQHFGAGRINARRALEAAPPPGLRLVPMEPVPDFVRPGRVTALTIGIEEAAESIAPGSARLWYRADGGIYVSTPLVPLGGGIYQADLPSQSCGAEVDYYVRVEGDGGAVATEPAGAPANTWHSTARFDRVLFADDFESDRGWAVITINPSQTHGVWERGDPRGMFNLTPADPPYDYTVPPGTHCYFTERHSGGSIGTNDVDFGPVRLLSPVIELQAPDAEINYARYFHSTGGIPDRLTVELSRDGGNTWVLVESVQHEPVWVPRSLRLSDFPQISGQLLRMRFSTSDDPSDSLTEAAIDDFSVRALSCTPIGGDYNLDGFVSLTDYLGLSECLLGPVFPYANTDCRRVDFDNDDHVNLRDVAAFGESFDP